MTTKRTNNEFDCVEMMHRGADRIRRETAGMTLAEKLDYWRRGEAELRRLQENARKRTPELIKKEQRVRAMLHGHDFGEQADPGDTLEKADDCVRQAIEGMSPEERLDYFRRGAAERELRKGARRKRVHERGQP